MATVSEVQSVLFISSGNSVRSIIAESVLNTLADGKFIAYSAGSHPTRKVHPLVLDVLQERGFSTDGLASKSWHTFSVALPEPLRYVIAVCAKTARVRPPAWPGNPLTLEWAFPDHTDAGQDGAELRCALSKLCIDIEAAVRTFLRQHA